MKKTKTFYWIFTTLFSLMMLFGAIPDILMDPQAVTYIHHDLGYPKYFIPFIGVAKVLGILAILLPVGNRIKEWAYAGLVFDLIGAMFSLFMVGKGDAFFLLLPLALGFLSYFFHHQKRKLDRLRADQPAERLAIMG